MRKKLTMLFASLFLVLGTAWADAPTPGQRYRLRNVMTGLYMQANGSSNLQLQEQKYSVLQFFSVEDAGDGKFYLKSESGVNMYVNASGWNAVVGSGSNTPYTIALVNGETDVYTLDQTVSSFTGKIGADANTAGTSLYCNKGEENNGKWQFEAVASPQICTFDPAKTYRIKSEYSGLYMQLVNTSTSGATEGAFQLKDFSPIGDGQKFTFEAAADGKYYLKAIKGETTYYVNHGDWNFHAGAEATTPFTIAVVDGHTAIYSLYQTANKWNTGMHGYAGNATTTATDGTKIYCNQPLNGNTIWSFEEVADNDPNNITDQTQLTNDSYYKISGERGFIFGADDVVKGTNAVSQAYSEGNKDQHFAIISKNDKLYLYNVGAKKFVVKSGNNTKLVDLPEQPITLEKTSDNNYVWSIKLNGTNKINLSKGYNDYGIYTDYNTEDSGNRWLIYKVGTFDPTEALATFDKVYVTVNYVLGSRTTVTKVETATVGSTFSVRCPSTYTTVASCTAGGNTLTETDGAYSFTVNEATTVTMNLDEDLPFTPSADFNSAAWHVMRIRPVRNGKEEFNWISKGESEPYTFSSERPTTDAGMWAFVGNPIDGFQIYNKAAGKESTLGVNGSNVVLQSGVKTWTIGQCIENGTLRGFYLYEGTENMYVHEYGGKFQIWNSTFAPTDGGSALVAEPAVVAEATNLYALKSPTGTYFNFTAVVPEPGAAMTYASFQEEPSFLYKVAENNSYYFESMSTPGEYIGVGPSNAYWIVAKDNKALWNISAEDANGYVIISRSTDANSRLGHDGNTNKGTGIFSNVGNTCFSWQLIPAYPVTIIYKNSKGDVTETVKTGVFVGESYTIDTKGQIVASYETDKGEVEVTDGVYTIPAVKGATTVTISIAPLGAVENPAAVVALVNRIGGTGTSNNFKFVHDPALNPDGETFEIGAEDSKILIKGSTISALTTGLGWYLNNIAHINIAWNSLNEKTTTVRWDEYAGYADLSHLPIPTETETHTSDAKYRYYLNYCTFGYSMTSWTWTRWQQEIDWMALHGINMPLQIVGLEEVWRKFLTLEENGQRKYNYSDSEAKAFVAGPAFTAWWGMNNLEGWGGTAADGWGGVQDDAWYERQQTLATQILTLQRALGMQPVLPGFSGMVPSNFKDKTGVECNAGSWGGFTRPKIVLPSNARFAEIAADYYACLKEVMGESQYYSMDPFHEGDEANASKEAYTAIYNAMETAKSGSQWVIQQWQWYGGNQTYSLQGVPAGKLIVLDLFSDGRPEFDKYGYDGYDPQEAVFCAIPNFGGRSGLMGRLQNVTDNYFKYKKQFTTIKGIGAAPEAIEQTPVAYDLLYQLPWMNGVKPDVAEWVDNYAVARYGKDNAIVKEAWSLLRQGPLNYGADAIQGPVEDVWAARPNLDATPASSWGTTLNGAGGTYTPARRQMLIDAVYKLIDQEDELELANGSVYKSNYMYDLVEFGGAVMADYAYDLLLGIKAAKNAEGTNGATYKARRDAFLQLILDMDAFRGTNLNFRLGKWTQEARDAAVEAQKYGATTANEDWYEFNNARTILTTWGDQGQNGNGAWNNGLKDYSYRSWQGLLADYYYPRWKYYFDNGCTHPNGNAKNYFYFEWNWAHGMKHQVGDTQKSTTRLAEGEAGYSYARDPEGNTVEEAVKMLGKYIIPVAMADGTHYAYRYLTNDLSSKVTIIATGNSIDLTQYFGALEGATVTGDFIEGQATDLTNIPLTADLDGAYTGTITLDDGTVLTFGVSANPKYYGAYRIKFNGSPVFIQYNEQTDNAGNVGYKVIGATGFGESGNQVSTGHTADYEADKIFTIVPSGKGYTLSAQGQYLKTTVTGTNWHHIMFSDQKGDAGTYVFTEAEGLVKLKSTNSGMASVSIYGNGAWGNDVDNKAKGFTFEEVTNYAITIPEGGLYTVCLPFNVVLPAGVTAYDVTVESLTSGADGAITTLDTIAVETEILKAGTPALLKATANTYNLTITMENNEAKTSSPESKLRGNFVKQTLQPGTNGLSKFVLDAATGKFALLDAEQEIPANTCWIEAKIDAKHVEVTEHKGKIVKVDDWLFEYDDATNGIKLKDVATPGDGNLEIKETFTINGKTQKVVAITPDFLENNKDVTEITLPSSLVNLGFRKVIPMFEASYEGVKGDTATYDKYGQLISSQGMHRCLVFPNDPVTSKPYVISKEFAWKLTLDVTIDRDGLSYNQWGSSIVSTDDNSLADSYFGFMQIYMWKDLQHIIVKIDNADDRYSYSTEALDEDGNVLKTVNGADSLLVNRHFTFELEHDGSGGYQVVIYYDNGKAKMYNITASENNKVSDFDRLYYSLPEGIHVNVKFDKLTNEGLFVGCTNLKAIHVHPDNPTFSSCEHGVLYDKNKYYVMRIPEGETSHHFEIPSKVVRLYPGAIHGVSADIVLHSNPEIGVVEGHDKHVKNAKFYLSLDDKDNTITEKETGYGGARDFISTNNNTYQSGRYKRAPLEAGKYGTIVLPFAPTNWKDKYDFFEMTDADATSFHFSPVDELYPNTAYLYKLKENPGTMEMEGDTLDVFETEEVFTVQTHAKYNPNDETSGDFRALGAYVNYFIETKNYPNSNYYTFSVSRQEFNRITKKLNYRPYRALFVVTPEEEGQAAQAPAKLSLRIRKGNGETTEIDPSQVEGMETPIYYDLQGRRVENPTSGVYIVNGKKVVL